MLWISRSVSTSLVSTASIFALPLFFVSFSALAEVASRSDNSADLLNVDPREIRDANSEARGCESAELNIDADSDGIADALDLCPSTINGGAVDVNGCLATTVIGPFEASYYNAESGALIATETVDRPAINYSWDEFHDIDSPNFHAVWEGDIELAAGLSEFTMSFDMSSSDVSLFVDDALVMAWSNGSKKIPLVLDAGPHTIRVEYQNNWHTVDFNTSFATYPELDKSQASEVIGSNLAEDTYVAYVGSYASKDKYRNVQVRVPETDKPVFLVLATYDSANWVIDNPASSNVVGIVVSSSSGSSTVSYAGSSIPIYRVPGMSRYNRLDAVKADILEVTGLQASYFFGEYDVTSVSIPYLSQDELDFDGGQVTNSMD